MSTDDAQTCYRPGTVLQDADGRHWLVHDDGLTATGTNGGLMVDLRRGSPVFSPYPGGPEQIHDAVEAVLISRWNEDVCHCEGGTDRCATYDGGPAPEPSSWTIEAVLGALAEVTRATAQE